MVANVRRLAVSTGLGSTTVFNNKQKLNNMFRFFTKAKKPVLQQTDCSTLLPSDFFLPILEENYQAQIAGYYNVDTTDEERKVRNAVIEEYRDLISIYKHKLGRQ